MIKKFNVIHVTGKGNVKLKSYENYNAIEICDNLSEVYNIVDIMVGRSGAGVSSECFFKSIPMILIPLQNKASRGDQLQNAKYYESLKIANILFEENLTPTKLFNAIIEFEKKYYEMKEIFKKLNIVNGRQKVIEIINTVIKR